MTTVASTAAGARAELTEHTVTVRLTPNDVTMIRAFIEWKQDSPTCSPKKHQIERGYGTQAFPRYQRHAGMKLVADTTGPNVFKRLVAIGVIEHAANGHCWLTPEGKRVAREIQ